MASRRRNRQETTPTVEESKAITPDNQDAEPVDESAIETAIMPSNDDSAETAPEAPQSGDLPAPAGATPASVSEPQSRPEAAVAVPGSHERIHQPVNARPRIDYAARAKPCPPWLLKRNDQWLATESKREESARHPEDYLEHMTAVVPCQIIVDELKGQLGMGGKFHFRRSEVILLPRWFGMSYPNAIIVKD